MAERTYEGWHNSSEIYKADRPRAEPIRGLQVERYDRFLARDDESTMPMRAAQPMRGGKRTHKQESGRKEPWHVKTSVA